MGSKLIPTASEERREYIIWNNLIVDHFFNQDNANKEVILFLTEEVIENIGKEKGMGMKSFIQAIISGISGLNISTVERICEDALKLFQEWKDVRKGPPPYVGYLAFFSLVAATQYDEFALNAYYPKFWKLLGSQNKEGVPKRFQYMQELWYDLEQWTKYDKSEELGIFTVRIRGKMRHVGIPLFQSLCSNDELNNLPRMFEAAYLDPLDPPNPKVILELIIKNEERIFKNRTIKMLKDDSSESKVFREALLMLVLDRLEDWDYEIPSLIHENVPKNDHRLSAGLRICMNIDIASRLAKCYLRFQSKKPIPEEGLIIRDSTNDEEYQCSGYINNWSSPLTKVGGHEIIDAKKMNWEKGGRFEDVDKKWIIWLRSSDVRVFKEGIDGLRDWVEVQRIERNNRYLVACTSTLEEEIVSWGKKSVSSFRAVEIVEGLPKGWRLFECPNIIESCKEIKQLTISNFTRVYIRRGIRSKGRNTYFSFALPNVVIEGKQGNERLIVNKYDRGVSNSNGEWHLSEYSLGVDLIHLEVLREGELLYNKYIRVESLGLIPDINGTPWRNSRGEISYNQNVEPLARGGCVIGIDEVQHFKDILPFQLSDKILIIGKVPGQVLEWPKEEIDVTWDPVWALIHVNKKIWEVHYVGNNMPTPMMSDKSPWEQDKKLLKLWKEVTYNRRKTTKKPRILILRKLWEEYVRCGKDVK